MTHLISSHIVPLKYVFLWGLCALTTLGCRESSPSSAPTTPTRTVTHQNRADDIPIVWTNPSIQGAESSESVQGQESRAKELATPQDSTVEEADDEAETESESAICLELMRITMARGVESHEPVEAAEQFTADGRPLVAFLQVANQCGNDLEVIINYEHEDGLNVGPARLTIPADSRGYRTFTRTRWVRHPGQWSVSARTVDGHLLGEAEFSIES